MKNLGDADYRDTNFARLFAMHATLQPPLPSDLTLGSVSTQFTNNSGSNSSALLSRSNTMGSPGSFDQQTLTYPPMGTYSVSDTPQMVESFTFDSGLIQNPNTKNRFTISSPNSTNRYNQGWALACALTQHMSHSNNEHQADTQQMPQHNQLRAFVQSYTVHTPNADSTPILLSTRDISSIPQSTDAIPMHTHQATLSSGPASMYSIASAQQGRAMQRDCIGLTPSLHAETAAQLWTNSSSSGNDDPTATSASLYVKNLPPEFDELALYQTFSPYGALQSCRVGVDPSTNKCKGVAWINYLDRECALKAQSQLNGVRITEGRNLHISLQAPKAIRNGTANMNGPGRSSGRQPVHASNAAPASNLGNSNRY